MKLKRIESEEMVKITVRNSSRIDYAVQHHYCEIYSRRLFRLPFLVPFFLLLLFLFTDVTGVDASIYKARTFSATDAQGAPFVSGFIFFYVLPLHLSTPPRRR